MRKVWLARVLGVLSISIPLTVSGADTLSRKDYADCIVRYANQSPSPQATVILQRACFYKYKFGKDDTGPSGVGAEQRKLSKIYTPEVCDCLFEKLPQCNPNVPAPTVLKHCVENSRKPQGSSAH